MTGDADRRTTADSPAESLDSETVTLLQTVVGPPDRAVLEALTGGHRTPGALAETTGLPGTDVERALARLTEWGLVTGGEAGYALTEAGQALGPVLEALDELAETCR